MLVLLAINTGTRKDTYASKSTMFNARSSLSWLKALKNNNERKKKVDVENILDPSKKTTTRTQNTRKQYILQKCILNLKKLISK